MLRQHRGISVATELFLKDVCHILDSIPLSSALPSVRSGKKDSKEFATQCLSLCLPPEGEGPPQQMSCPRQKSPMSLSLRPIKLILFVCSNNLQNYPDDIAFCLSTQELQFMPDVIENLLQLVATHNVIWVIGRILDMETSATKIFGVRALICAVYMENRQLVDQILLRRPPLELVKLLLDVGCDPDGFTNRHQHDGWERETPLEALLLFSKHAPRLELEVFQAIMDAQFSAHPIHRIQRSWKILAQIAIQVQAENAFILIMQNYARLQPLSPPLNDPFLALEIALWRSKLELPKILIGRAFRDDTTFEFQSLHAKLKFLSGTEGAE